MDEDNGLCHCGKPLHYSDPELRKTVEKLVSELGAYMSVHNLADGKTYWVQRHYVALHGIKSVDLSTLGFKTVKIKPRVK